MSHCCHKASQTIIDPFLGSSELGLFVSIIITGVSSSFVHCIGMCGPIAMAQMNMRLMHLSGEKLSQIDRIKVALMIPYYLGKSATYFIITFLLYIFSSALRDMPTFRYIGAILLILAGILLLLLPLKIVVSSIFQKVGKRINFVERLESYLVKRFENVYLRPFGLQGFLLGMILGFIPCGIVYGMMILTLSHSSSPLVAGVAMVIFSFSTLPGLFLVAYSGQAIITRYRNIARPIYFIVMLFNSMLLFRYGITLAC